VGAVPLEHQHDGGELDEDGEPSLGSFDRLVNQHHSSGDVRVDVLDGEVDNCDREDNDPGEVSDVSGIGDQDGLLEQVSGHQSFLGRVIGPIVSPVINPPVHADGFFPLPSTLRSI
jgi:hypothetical protein